MSIQRSKLSSDYPTDFYNLTIVTAVDKNNKVAYSFTKKFVDITPSPVKITSFDDVNRWYDDSMLYYCQQYKFALYCATALCGVSKDHLTRGLPLTRSIINFHVLYQTKRILAQMRARNPGDMDFDAHNNAYDKTEYRKLLNEFDAVAKDIPEIDQPAGGLGYMRVSFGNDAKSKLMYHKGAYPKFPSTGLDNPYINVQKTDSDWGTYYQFGGGGYPIDAVQQDTFNYNRIIPDHNTASFTNPGFVRINDSIRAYVYCLLGAQVQARQAGSSLESQQEFLTLVNDLIAKQQSLQESIGNFQDSLSKTAGQINYVVYKGLYMLPADMNLNRLGRSVRGFNDQLKIAKAFDGVGIKPDPPAPKPAVQLPAPKPYVKPKPAVQLPAPKLYVKPKPYVQLPAPKPYVKPKPYVQLATPKPVPKVSVKLPQSSVVKRSADTHEGTKLFIGSGIVAAGIAYSMFA